MATLDAASKMKYKMPILNLIREYTLNQKFVIKIFHRAFYLKYLYNSVNFFKFKILEAK